MIGLWTTRLFHILNLARDKTGPWIPALRRRWVFYPVFAAWSTLIAVIISISLLFVIQGYIGLGILIYVISLFCIWYISVSSLWVIFQENFFGIVISAQDGNDNKEPGSGQEDIDHDV